RRDKTIGSSLEAAPSVTISDDALFEAVTSLDALADIFITSAIDITKGETPGDEAVSVTFAKADGEKCMRCWKILADVGTHSHAHTCARCNEALG
ncbi:MAG: zinc finger domain-containing protein, partial [Erythrobacter sp.]